MGKIKDFIYRTKVTAAPKARVRGHCALCDDNIPKKENRFCDKCSDLFSYGRLDLEPGIIARNCSAIRWLEDHGREVKGLAWFCKKRDALLAARDRELADRQKKAEKDSIRALERLE